MRIRHLSRLANDSNYRGYGVVGLDSLVEDVVGAEVATASQRSPIQSVMLGVGTAIATHLAIKFIDKFFGR